MEEELKKEKPMSGGDLGAGGQRLWERGLSLGIPEAFSSEEDGPRGWAVGGVEMQRTLFQFAE